MMETERKRWKKRRKMEKRLRKTEGKAEGREKEYSGGMREQVIGVRLGIR